MMSGSSSRRSGAAERLAERRRRVAKLVPDRPAEGALIDEADVGGQPGKPTFTASDVLQRGSNPEPEPVSGDRVARPCAEGSAEVMNGDIEHLCELT